MNKINYLDHIYLLNHKDFSERLQLITTKLKNENIDYELVQVGHPNEIDYEKLLEGWEFCEKMNIVHPYGVYDNFSVKISPGSLSLVLKHLWCFKDQIEKNYENVLILEDDANLPVNFKNFLENNMKDFLELQKTEKTEMLMIGTSHHFISKGCKVGKYAHYYPTQKCRCTHAYVLNINATKKIVERFKLINKPIDHKLNEILQLEDIKVAWSEPGIRQI